jgi:hypothetical protein
MYLRSSCDDQFPAPRFFPWIKLGASVIVANVPLELSAFAISLWSLSVNPLSSFEIRDLTERNGDSICLG